MYHKFAGESCSACNLSEINNILFHNVVYINLLCNALLLRCESVVKKHAASCRSTHQKRKPGGKFLCSLRGARIFLRKTRRS